ncbi:patatin-like phospholipase family protein [Cocleimonas sp. KMM 6892]|uniref:patatin-like phospholipase family protein n=1 Tax=unclassified Cocleimonas TaxID=2639732 RepID=UPI002DBFE7C1|nr:MULTISPECIES: patatin-like phospholipase family protein [unclassified Cocleimonas]MEB8434397.1 patatin-like phospholipase family protein [Cocleimonas sp. KMM 6892]MEC4717200.1 patatin-like phospholipase family protein [Cocleimonas sp. KMM 6895]MEC4746579.1 patatin-like phospholipase family protein [Cocleimonas sp. KMM 6896]
MKIIIRNVVILVCFATLSACSTLPRHPAPLDKMLSAKISGMSGVRAWSGTFSKDFESDLLLSIKQEKSHLAASSLVKLPASSVLTLSGGGDNGAFGAGFLQGWTKTGTRPTFKLVTGISTGALIAPFAFIGPEYDATLQEAFTTIDANNIYFPRWISFMWSDSFTDTAPLLRLIKRYITNDVLNKVALAHRQGRRLFIGTTNLDADRLVVWNMGAIANSGHPKALELFQQIILASSSVPVAFPPVLIKVEADGKTYDEMHVDGGVKAQLFFLAATLDLTDFRKKLNLVEEPNRKMSIYIIRNAEIGPELKQVPRNLTKISERALSSMIKSQALNDLNRVYGLAKTQGLDFNWVALPEEYEPTESDEFDRKEMNRLFKKGYEQGLKKDVWKKVPPGINY